MEIKDKRIDRGNAFDWGRASEDYARYRDIYPEAFYKCLTDRGLCVNGQRVLDIGTGTGVLPRNMYKYGALWTGTDISENQIIQARLMSENSGMDISYHVSSAEDLVFGDGSFDVITACQCYWYFDHKRTAPLFARLLNESGKLVFMMMNWLPFEDEIAAESESLVLKYNLDWSGCGDTFREIVLPQEYFKHFDLKESFSFRLPVRFTRESWNGRIKACRGIGASGLSDDEKAAWEKEHLEMLKTYPEEFNIAHYAAFAILEKK
ncbi:Methyltransferase domain-containing protein [Ruminococcaceae bacterium FB2012]|nr:Methyltransferase domain-containing protein [Ruminococcaceae bacterium FB2012]